MRGRWRADGTRGECRAAEYEVGRRGNDSAAGAAAVVPGFARAPKWAFLETAVVPNDKRDVTGEKGVEKGRQIADQRAPSPATPRDARPTMRVDAHILAADTQ